MPADPVLQAFMAMADALGDTGETAPAALFRALYPFEGYNIT